jgi:hypothetical protein
VAHIRKKKCDRCLRAVFLNFGKLSVKMFIMLEW